MFVALGFVVARYCSWLLDRVCNNDKSNCCAEEFPYAWHEIESDLEALLVSTSWVEKSPPPRQNFGIFNSCLLVHVGGYQAICRQ